MKNADMPAMPVTDEAGMPFKDVPGESCTMGLTKREHFAAMAMQGIISADHANGSEKLCAEDVAVMAVDYADELLKELEGTK